MTTLLSTDDEPATPPVRATLAARIQRQSRTFDLRSIRFCRYNLLSGPFRENYTFVL